MTSNAPAASAHGPVVSNPPSPVTVKVNRPYARAENQPPFSREDVAGALEARYDEARNRIFNGESATALSVSSHQVEAQPQPPPPQPAQQRGVTADDSGAGHGSGAVLMRRGKYASATRGTVERDEQHEYRRNETAYYANARGGGYGGGGYPRGMQSLHHPHQHQHHPQSHQHHQHQMHMQQQLYPQPSGPYFNKINNRPASQDYHGAQYPTEAFLQHQQSQQYYQQQQQQQQQQPSHDSHHQHTYGHGYERAAGAYQQGGYTPASHQQHHSYAGGYAVPSPGLSAGGFAPPPASQRYDAGSQYPPYHHGVMQGPPMHNLPQQQQHVPGVYQQPYNAGPQPLAVSSIGSPLRQPMAAAPSSGPAPPAQAAGPAIGANLPPVPQPPPSWQQLFPQLVHTQSNPSVQVGWQGQQQ